MSTVLWANLLLEGKVTSDQNDNYALYRHSKKLDRLTRELGVCSFLSVQDFTDVQFNLSQEELPPGFESTDEVMATSGTWLAAADAVDMLTALIDKIRRDNVRFGFFRDGRDDVLDELERSLSFAAGAAGTGAMFNFSVVT